MLNGIILIEKIDYEKTFRSLYPVIKTKLEGIEEKNFAVRFLLKMGEMSITAIIGILALLEDSVKTEILCDVVNEYANVIADKINQKFSTDLLASAIHISAINLINEEAELRIQMQGVVIDYYSLSKNILVQDKIMESAEKIDLGLGRSVNKVFHKSAGKVAEMTAKFFPKELEKRGLDILLSNENRNRIIKIVENLLEENGIFLKIKEFQLKQSKEVRSEIYRMSSDNGRLFSTSIEDNIMDAVVQYIKSLLEQDKDKKKEDDFVMEHGKLLQFNRWKFRYVQEVKLPCSEYTFELNGKFVKPNNLKKQLEVEYSENVSKYRNEMNQPVLVLYESIPTFDSGDRMYDSYKELYIYVENHHLAALKIRGGYQLGEVLYYPEIFCADMDTVKLLQNMQIVQHD